jgi:hypothetical protein
MTKREAEICEDAKFATNTGTALPRLATPKSPHIKSSANQAGLRSGRRVKKLVQPGCRLMRPAKYGATRFAGILFWAKTEYHCSRWFE